MSRGVIPASTDQEQPARETDEVPACPLCDFDATEQTDIYVHLQTAHRKSTLATAILDELSES